MADKTLRLANFKYGLDSRRADLASQPGTLQTCENAYINAGGEADKRLMFYNAGVTFPENTFGLQDVEGGMETYGSDSDATPLPADVAYVQLTSPGGGEMVRVVDSCNADGKAFVIAEFTDGTYCFYDGELIESSRNGLVLTGQESIEDLAEALAAQINAVGLGWVAVPNEDENGAQPGAVLITSPPGVRFEAVPDDSGSENGVIGHRVVDYDFAGTPGARAASKFMITNLGAVGDTYEVFAPKNEDGTGTVDISGVVTVESGDTLVTMAEKISDAINARTFLTSTTLGVTDPDGYIADNDGVSTVFVYAPLSWGDGPNAAGFEMDVTTSGSATVGPSIINASLQVYVTPANTEKTLVSNTALRDVTSDPVTAYGVAGSLPYSFAWTAISQSETDPDDQIFPLDDTAPVTQFRTRLLGFGTRTAVWRVTITDGIANTDTFDVNISLSHESSL